MAKNDSVVLRMQVGVNKAYDLLTMFKEAGKSLIDDPGRSVTEDCEL